MRAGFFTLSLIACLHGGPAQAASIEEPDTGLSVEAERVVDGRGYALVGLGAKKKLTGAQYAMGLYVEKVDGRRAFSSLALKAGGSDRAKVTQGDRAQSFIVWGQFGKLATLKFVRDTAADKLRASFEEGLAEERSTKAAPDVREATQAFLKLCERDVKAGEPVDLRTTADGKITLSIAGEVRGEVQSIKLARAIWNVWLGGKPVSKELRTALVSRIDELGR